jgi:hypothetical protein
MACAVCLRGWMPCALKNWRMLASAAPLYTEDSWQMWVSSSRIAVSLQDTRRSGQLVLVIYMSGN